MTSGRATRPGLLIAGLILLLAAWLRLPAITTGLPFFYHEDEAHHFNRVVRMVKEGRLDPEYFHKPSLHFYLRMPAVLAGYLWSRYRGEARSLEDIASADRFGLGRYTFSASHPPVAVAARGVSFALSLAVVLLAGLITAELGAPRGAVVLATLLTAVSPDLIRLSGFIGVDVLMAATSLGAVYLALRLHRRYSGSLLVACGLMAGLAISSKYNAAPIGVLPTLALWCAGTLTRQRLLLALLLPVAGFLIGTPYLIFSIPLFIEQVTYEVWHYAVAGHEGHTGEPGIHQLLFYLRWLGSDGVGLIAGVVALIGLIPALRIPHRRGIVFLAFPLLFLVLMSAQRANFTRNLLVLIPIAAILAAVGAAWLTRIIRIPGAGAGIATGVLGLLVLALPARDALGVRRELTDVVESRQELMAWLDAHPISGDTAVAGELELPRSFFNRPGLIRMGQSQMDAAQLYAAGFDRVVVDSTWSGTGVRELLNLPGEAAPQRVVENPAIRVLELTEGGSTPPLITCTGPDGCTPREVGEDHAWLSRRRGTLIFRPTSHGEELEVMSPWAGQVISIGGTTISFTEEEAGMWKRFGRAVPGEALTRGVPVQVTKIFSPAARGVSSDERRLGVAFRTVLPDAPAIPVRTP